MRSAKLSGRSVRTRVQSPSMTRGRSLPRRPAFRLTLWSALTLLSCGGGQGPGSSVAGQGGAAGSLPPGSGGTAGVATAAGAGGSLPAAGDSGSGGDPAGKGGGDSSGGVAGGGGTAGEGSGAVAGSGGSDTAGSAGATENGGSSSDAGSSSMPGGSAGASNEGGAAGGGAPSWNGTLPQFTKHTIASFNGGYSTFTADIDHDGKPDVVALSSSSAGLVWFKNPSWQKHGITTKSKQLIHAAAHDVDGDGDLDVAFVSEFDTNNTTSGGTISWAEAPADPTQSEEWAIHKIGGIPTTHRLAWADLEGNGTKELLALPIFGEGSSAPAHAGAVHFTAYTIPADPLGTWSSRVIDDQHLEVAHCLQILDWDADGKGDMLTAANDGVDLYRPSTATPYLHLGAGKQGQAPDRGSSEVGLGHLGSQRFLATIEFWHGTDTVLYTPGANDAELWTRKVLGSDFEHGHGLVVADLNGDGYDEIVGGGGEGAMKQLIYRYVPSSGMWDKIELDIGGVAVSAIEAKDLNGDGALDLLSIGTSPTNNVVWYESTP